MALADEVRYPEAISEKDVREIKRIKARVESERLPQGADPSRHLKLGRGSLSDVEWFVQLLQLQHGARDREPENDVDAGGPCRRDAGELWSAKRMRTGCARRGCSPRARVRR